MEGQGGEERPTSSEAANMLFQATGLRALESHSAPASPANPSTTAARRQRRRRRRRERNRGELALRNRTVFLDSDRAAIVLLRRSMPLDGESLNYTEEIINAVAIERDLFEGCIIRRNVDGSEDSLPETPPSGRNFILLPETPGHTSIQRLMEQLEDHLRDREEHE
ncbi:hypothetical protein Aperf_G00000051855 [Anoplocephala perfoliata]